jgi:hypothetical protein
MVQAAARRYHKLRSNFNLSHAAVNLIGVPQRGLTALVAKRFRRRYLDASR